MPMSLGPVVTDAALPQQAPIRIWVLHCPFTKTGFPNLGHFGSSVRPVVIIPLAAWQKLCADIPALAATPFEVGSVD
jgi:hypothetical protein